jgi:hypothetical protein
VVKAYKPLKRVMYLVVTIQSNKHKNKHYTIVTWGLKARTVEPEETSIAREWLCKPFPQQPNYVTTVMVMHETTEKLL